MRAIRTRAAAAAVVVLAVALSACGGGGSKPVPTSTGTGGPTTIIEPKKPGDATTVEFDKAALDQAAVRSSVEAVLASGDPSKACGESVTPAYVTRAYGDHKACVQAQKPGSAARSVAIDRIEIAGRAAKAMAVPSGGPSNGETITVSLVFAGGVWKVDALKSNAPVGP
jgi:hypothetical protein